MTREQALKMAKAKLECIERRTSGKTELCREDCESCSLCYEQGNMGDQMKWLKMSVKALEQEPKADVLDKIRNEMTDLAARTMNDNRASGIWTCVDILDKYKRK